MAAFNSPRIALMLLRNAVAAVSLEGALASFPYAADNARLTVAASSNVAIAGGISGVGALMRDEIFPLPIATVGGAGG